MLRKQFSFLTILFICASPNSIAQNSCYPSNFQFNSTTKNRIIEWQKFPEFSLPFKIIYGGNRLGDKQKLPLKYGFSHIATLEGNDPDLEPKNRAMLWYGTAYVDGKQPWETIRSPYGNNLELYRTKWKREINDFGNTFHSTFQKGILDAELFVFDIERQLYTNNDILQLKNHSTTPNEIKLLDNQSFINRYKSDLQKLYAEPLKFTRANGATQNTKFGSYGDAPLNPFIISIASNSWQKWISDKTFLNYLNYDFSKNDIGGDFYNQQDFLTPSTYYYFDYPNALAGDYLPYLLFMVEANKAVSKKPIIPFVWLRYDATDRENHQKFIKPFMAEASAIFPLIAGASGIWLWENPELFSKDENLSVYENFIFGLYRLSLFKEMFEGNPEFIMPTPPNEYTDTRKPIWRGIVKGNNILVAAHNSYAKSENEVVNLEISYKNWKQNITLKGYEVFLCKFDMNQLSLENQSFINNFKVFPNPANDVLNLSFSSTKNTQTQLEIIDLQGKTVYSENISIEIGENKKILKVDFLPLNNYILRLNNHLVHKITK